METISSYEKVEKDAKKMIANLAKKSGNELLEEIAEQNEPKQKHERMVHERVIRNIIDECLEDYRESEYDLKTTIKNINEALEDLCD